MTRESCGGDSSNGTGLEKRGTGSGTGRTTKIINVYRPWYTGTGIYPGEHPPAALPTGPRRGMPVFHRKQRRTLNIITSNYSTITYCCRDPPPIPGDVQLLEGARKVYGRSWKVVEGAGRFWKVTPPGGVNIPAGGAFPDFLAGAFQGFSANPFLIPPKTARNQLWC
jgi:hypothetical protein